MNLTTILDDLSNRICVLLTDGDYTVERYGSNFKFICRRPLIRF